MTQYNTFTVKSPNSQLKNLNRLLSSNVVGDSNDEKNFPHKLLITNTFANGSSADIKLPKTQLHEKG